MCELAFFTVWQLIANDIQQYLTARQEVEKWHLVEH